ncbi:MAG: acyltransferase [Butyrivibrio sp.]|nr:acyltransferase [Butyrivibrio sp.]
MANHKSRESNIELLRILAIIGVIVLHYNNPVYGKGFVNYDKGIERIILIVLESLSICAVNLFVLISGYFMAGKNKRDFLKPAELLFKVALFGSVFFLVSIFATGMEINFDNFLRFYIPDKWFVFVYIALYLFSPYINIVWKNLDASGKRLILIMSAIAFSIYPTIVDELALLSGRQLNGTMPIGVTGDAGGYTLVNFVFIYLIGCYIRDCANENRKIAGQKKLFIFLIADLILISLWAYADIMAKGVMPGDSVSYNYNNPLVVIETVLIFLLFRNMKSFESGLINYLAAGTFTTYIVHIRFIEIFQIGEKVNSSVFMLAMDIVKSVIMVYASCILVYALFELILRPIRSFVIRRWKTHRFFEV